MGQENPDRAGAASRPATPEGTGHRRERSEFVGLAAGQLPDQAGTHREAGENDLAAIEMEPVDRVRHHLVQERRLVTHRRLRTQRPEATLAPFARRAGRGEQHEAACGHRPRQFGIGHNRLTRTARTVQEEHSTSRRIAGLPRRRGREVLPRRHQAGRVRRAAPGGCRACRDAQQQDGGDNTC